MSDEDELAELEERARRELLRLHADALRGPRPGVEGRILAGLDYRARPALRRPWLAAAVAALLGAMAVTGLLSTRLLLPPGNRSGLTVPPPTASASAPPATTQPSAAPLPCRLPLDRGGTGAFLTVPASGVQKNMVPYAQPSDDPGGHPRLPDGEDPVNVSYSWALARWLPVRGEWVAADGSHYTYSDRVGTLHAVDARSGRDRRLNGDRAWAVIAYEPEGIYAGAASVSSSAATGLWLVDPATGRARQLQSAGAWQYVRAGAAWALKATQPAVAPRYTPSDGLYGNTLVRLDLQSGKTVTLYARPDTELRMVGLDSDGNPYVTELAQGPTSLLEVTGPGRVVQTGSGAWVNAARDDGRTWFGESYGPSVWLKDSAGIRAMVGPGSGQVRVAGGCH